MPRLPQTQADKQYKTVRYHIAAYIDDRTRAGWDSRQIASALGFNYATLLSRRNNPQSFTLEELQRIANVLNITVPTLIGAQQNSIR